MANRLDLTLRINSEDRTGPARAGIQSVEQQLTRLRQTAGAFLALKVGEIIGSQIGNVIKTADAYKTLEARLKLVSDNTSEYNKAQTELFGIAQRTRGDLEGTYDVYGKLETAIKALGGTQKQALTTTETLNQALALTSQGAAQDAAVLLQFSQALGSGVLRGDEFNSVMENSPGLAQALADGLNVPIGSLRGMAEAGQLTADKLINALGNSAKSVEDKFKQLPLTVGGSMTQLGNAFTMFIGQADKSSGASATLASGISLLANNLDAAGGAIKLIGAALLGNYVTGLIKSGEATLANRYATLQLAQAQQARLAVLQQTLRAEVLAAESKLAGINLNVRLAATEQQAAMGTVRQAEATNAYIIQLNRQKIAQTQLATANTRLAGTMAAAAPATGRLAGAMNLLGKAVSGVFAAFIAWDIGQTVGEWLNQFEKVRQGGSYLAETFILIQSGFEAMLSGMSFAERWAQVKQIHEDFNQIRAQSTDAAIQSAAQVNAAEQSKTETLEAASLKQQVSFKMVQDAAKALTASIDTESKQQTTLIEQSLSDRMAAIDAMDITETQKDTLRVTAKLAAYQQLAQLQQQASDAKLVLIEQEYAKELTQAAANAQRTVELEAQKRQAKLAVYTGLAEYYQGEVAKLAGVYASEFQAAQQARQQLQQLNKSHEQALFDIKLMGMNEREQLEAKQSEYNKKLVEIRKEQAKGEQADQEKINTLLDEAKTLNADITRTAGKGSEEIQKAKERENQIYKLQKGVLEDNAKAHEANAERAKTAQASVAEKLAVTRNAITEITDKLNQDYELKVGIDQASLASIQSTIAELTKPETKVITIVTQNAQAAGGPVGYAQGGPVQGFAKGGGYARLSGRLPGFGGGDKVRALLEAGEWIIRKEAVKRIENTYGEGAMHLVNAGKMPVKRALGGPVGFNMDDELKKLKEDRDRKIIDQMVQNVLWYGMSSIGTFSLIRASYNAEKTLRRINRLDLKQKVADIFANSVGRAGADNRNKFDKAAVLKAHLFDAPADMSQDSLTSSSVINDEDSQVQRFMPETDDSESRLTSSYPGDNPSMAKIRSDSVPNGFILSDGKQKSSASLYPPPEGRGFTDNLVTKPAVSLPAFKLPEIVTRFNEAAPFGSAPFGSAQGTNGSRSASLTASAQGTAQKTVNVNFAMPGGEAVSGQFNESDIDKLFKTLKDAGLRSTGGHF